ncbi:succinoglycan biosynthesis protein ExoM [Duganella caerulea]|uniref:glycosyltransferase family 2 protein n=1 Tax=Duganella caerulea TaxID=2885762 RepID=UPI0030E8A199
MPATPPSPPSVDVCIATYRRPAMLAALLAALAGQRPGTLAPRVIVIDNDRDGSARPVVEQARAAGGPPLLYQIEPVQNIALARNRALALCRAEFIAFIDDDETPCPGWLAALLECAGRYQADVVFGPVHSVLPPHAPAWTTACFRKASLPTGAPVRVGGAGNVLLRRAALAAGDGFDPAFGLTGGEDTDWFHRLHLRGRRLVWCAEAEVSEPVAELRLQPRWLRRRAFRSGQTYYRVFVRRYRAGASVLWFSTKLLQLLGGLALAPLLRVASYPAYMALTLRLAGAAGQLSRCLGAADFEEYHARHHR